ncbi:MAG: dihydroneopterin aldolase [Flavobacteriaceae bacterium]|nr:dihydroneopterin aldolase [Flavobacteriaceae bacterium]
MGMIYLKNIKVFAYHGCLAEETLIGSDYIVALKVWADLKKSTASDQLGDTVDYVLLNAIVKEEMATPSKLLEHVAQRIIQSVFKQSNLVDKVQVSVAKINPPIGGDVASVSVVLKEKRV